MEVKEPTPLPDNLVDEFNRFGVTTLTHPSYLLSIEQVMRLRSCIMAEFRYIQHIREKRKLNPDNFYEVTRRGPGRYDIKLDFLRVRDQYWLAPIQQKWLPSVQQLCGFPSTAPSPFKTYTVTFMVSDPTDPKHKNQNFHIDSPDPNVINVFVPMIQMKPEYGLTQ